MADLVKDDGAKAPRKPGRMEGILKLALRNPDAPETHAVLLKLFGGAAEREDGHRQTEPISPDREDCGLLL